jgi:hypothetical protein
MKSLQPEVERELRKQRRVIAALTETVVNLHNRISELEGNQPSPRLTILPELPELEDAA